MTDLSRDVVRASTVAPGATRSGMPINSLGFDLVCPGGYECYPALWVRDFAMSLDSGCIGVGCALKTLCLIASRQNGPAARNLDHALVPPWSICDHILFDGSAVFFPGTYSPGNDQGGEPFGTLPPVGDHYEFIHIAHWLARQGTNASFLADEIDHVTLWERLCRAFDAPDTDPETGLTISSPQRRAVGFGFYDSVYLTGAMAYSSLLRLRAARQMAELAGAHGDRSAAERFARVAERLGLAIAEAFAVRDGRGWLLAATEIGAVPDVWATLLALHLEALPAPLLDELRHTVMRAVRAGSIEHRAAVCHVPTDHRQPDGACWPRTAEGFGSISYQNGGYWHTPTGWLIEAVASADAEMAQGLLSRYISAVTAEDFRNTDAEGAPWEWILPDGTRDKGAYMTSVTLPLGVLRNLQPRDEA